MGNSRVLALRRADRCSVCASPVDKGERAYWNADDRAVTCLTCHDRWEEPSEHRGMSDAGVAGGSAQREFDRQHTKREEEVLANHPKIGHFLLAAFDDPQRTRAWAKGAEGERRLGKILDELASDTFVVLHDRRQPRSTANFDHIVISRVGVTVVDAKFYKGTVTQKYVGGLLHSEPRLFVDKRDRTNLVAGVIKQIDRLKDLLAAVDVDVPVHGALCFIDAQWPIFSKPFTIDGVGVSGPKSLSKKLTAAGPIEPPAIGHIAHVLDSRLRAAAPPPSNVGSDVHPAGNHR